MLLVISVFAAISGILLAMGGHKVAASVCIGIAAGCITYDLMN